MNASRSENTTRYLTRIRAGDPAALAEFLPVVYNELRALAQSYLGRRGDRTLQATELVHEAYLRLIEHATIEWESRAHFFAVAAKAMRQIIIDYLRARGTQKRGADWDRVTLAGMIAPDDRRDVALLDLHEALEKLSALDMRLSQIVELKFFGGLNMDEIAHVLRLSKPTVEREWRVSRAWLSGQLRTGEHDDA